MTTVNRTIESEHDKDMATKLIEARTVPFTLTLTDGKHRTTAQNRLQRLWINEISAQRGDLTPEEARGYCKLTIGVPLLREENEAFAKEYDEVVKPLPYEAKLKLMMIPFDFGVTRLMTSKQKTIYLDRIAQHFGEQGIVLTMPEDMKQPEPGASPVPGSDDEPTPPARRQEDAAELTQPSHAAAASSPQSPEQWLIEVARMLWAATNFGGDLDILKAQKLGIRDGYPKPDGCPKAISDKAESIFGYCKDVVLSAYEKEEALPVIAGIVGCDPSELGGRSND